MLKRFILMAVLLAVLLVPWNTMYAVDGGTVVHSALLYTITKRHAMCWEEEVFGYRTGAEIEIFFLEVYNDVRFIPAISYLEKNDVSEEVILKHIHGCSRDVLIREWGIPDFELSGFYGDRWDLSDERYIVVYYDDQSLVNSITMQK